MRPTPSTHEGFSRSAVSPAPPATRRSPCALGAVGGALTLGSAFVALLARDGPPPTALTLQICLGFLLTMVSMRLLPMVASAPGWQCAFLPLVPGPIVGALAMRRLART